MKRGKRGNLWWWGPFALNTRMPWAPRRYAGRGMEGGFVVCIGVKRLQVGGAQPWKRFS